METSYDDFAEDEHLSIRRIESRLGICILIGINSTFDVLYHCSS